MSPRQALPRTLALGVVVAFLAGSATTERARPQPAPGERKVPTLRLHTDRKRPDPVKASCPSPAEVVLVRGPVPDRGEVVAELTLTAVDRPALLATYESVLREWAAKHCCSGVSLLQAEAVGDGRPITAVEAAAWTEVMRAPAGAPADEESPTPAEKEEAFWD